MNKVIVVIGPTAVGKTKLAIDLAKHYGVEIVSGDSIAVYKRLDIGSAKPTKLEMGEVKHHLIDVLDPKEEYSVADFQKAARAVLDKNPVTIICGGTGLYIQSTLFDYEFIAKKRNNEIEEKYKDYTDEELYEELKRIDHNFDENKIHCHNRRRVLRALEVALDTGNSIASYNNKEKPLYDYFIVYLTLEREVLYERINKRVDLMIENGLLAEVKQLYDEGIRPKGIGYKELIKYFDGEISLVEAVDEIKKNSRHLAKRQITWFKNQLNSHFYNINLSDYEKTLTEVIQDIDGWLEK